MPRIFIAIRFNDEFKQKLVEIQDTLKIRGVSGNYCPYGNLHMTLAFIGETYDLSAIRDAVSEVTFESSRQQRKMPRALKRRTLTNMNLLDYKYKTLSTCAKSFYNPSPVNSLCYRMLSVITL